MEDLKKKFKRTEDLHRQRQERPKSWSSAPHAPLNLLGEEQVLERDEEQSNKQAEVRKGNFLQKNGADGFTDWILANL